MRKTGIYIVLGITISLSVFIFAGILYFRPAIQEAAPIVKAPISVVTEPPRVPVAPAPPKPPAPVPAQVPPAPAEVVEKPAPVVEAPVIEVVEKPAEVVETPVIEVEEIPEPVVQPPKPVVPPPPIVRMTVSAHEALEPLVPEVLEEPEILEVSEEPEVSEMPEEPEVLEVLEELPIVEPVSERRVIEPEKHDRPVLRVPASPRIPADVRSVLPFVRPEPVTYIWTPVVVPEGPTQHVDPITFSKEAFERRRIAVDEVLEKLIWE